MTWRTTFWDHCASGQGTSRIPVGRANQVSATNVADSANRRYSISSRGPQTDGLIPGTGAHSTPFRGSLFRLSEAAAASGRAAGARRRGAARPQEDRDDAEHLRPRAAGHAEGCGGGARWGCCMGVHKGRQCRVMPLNASPLSVLSIR